MDNEGTRDKYVRPTHQVVVETYVMNELMSRDDSQSMMMGLSQHYTVDASSGTVDVHSTSR